MTASTSGSATGPGAAACQVGRRPLLVSPYRVNWLTTSSGAPRSSQDFSPSRMRRPQSFLGEFARYAGGVVVGDADQHEQPRFVDRAGDLTVDGDTGLGHPLHDCSHEMPA